MSICGIGESTYLYVHFKSSILASVPLPLLFAPVDDFLKLYTKLKLNKVLDELAFFFNASMFTRKLNVRLVQCGIAKFCVGFFNK